MTEFEAKKIYLKNTQGDYVVPIGYSAKYDMNGDEIIVSELEADQTYDSTSTRAQSGVAVAEAIAGRGEEESDTSVTELSTSGTITLEDNKVYRITPSGSIIFALPENGLSSPIQVGNSSWRSITYGNDKFVAVGGSTNELTGSIATSIDGITWTNQSLTNDRVWFDVAYGNNTFVVVGYEGYVVSSSDGINWIESLVGNISYWTSIIFVDGTFYATADSGYISSSVDGINWTESIQVDTEYGDLRDIVYDNGKFIAVGDNGYITTSTNGTTWSTPVQVDSYTWYSVTYGNGKFVAVGSEGYITTSTNGTTWSTPVQVGTGTYDWQGVTYGSGKFVAVGRNGYIATSTNGTTWSTPVQVNYDWFNIYYNNNSKFFITGNNGYITDMILLDLGKFHQMLVQVNMTTVQTIDVGTNMFFNLVQPDLSEVGIYDLLFEYDNNNNCWVCGLLSKSQVV